MSCPAVAGAEERDCEAGNGCEGCGHGELGQGQWLQAEQVAKWWQHEGNDLTGGLGADVAIEAVGVPATFELCAQVVRPGGRIANVGVHGAPATLHLEDLWIRDVTITTGLVDTVTTPRLLSMLAAGRLAMPGLITHRFGLDEMQDAYDVFSRAGETGALKVALFTEQGMEPEHR